MGAFIMRGIKGVKYMYTLANEIYEPYLMSCLQKYDDLAPLAKAISQGDIHIQFIESDKRKVRHEFDVLADCTKLSGKAEAVSGTQFVITYYLTSQKLKEEGLEILTWHELKHIGIDSNGKFYTADHDLQDFKIIIEKYGVDWESKYTNEN